MHTDIVEALAQAKYWADESTNGEVALAQAVKAASDAKAKLKTAETKAWFDSTAKTVKDKEMQVYGMTAELAAAVDEAVYHRNMVESMWNNAKRYYAISMEEVRYLTTSKGDNENV